MNINPVSFSKKKANDAANKDNQAQVIA